MSEQKVDNHNERSDDNRSKVEKNVEKIALKVCDVFSGGEVEIVVDGLENIPEGAVIFASTHQGLLDNFVWIPQCPKHSVIFHSAETSKLLLAAQVDIGLILVTKEKRILKIECMQNLI